MVDAHLNAIELSRNLVRENRGPETLMVVVGTSDERAYWQDRLTTTVRHTLRSDGLTNVLSLEEAQPLGNFLGTLNAWKDIRRRRPEEDHPEQSHTLLISMLFGRGTRLSPFTQVLGNSKSKFPTPYWIEDSNAYLSIGELSGSYANLIVSHLRESDFRGALVKWGDEVLIPGARWKSGRDDLLDVDAVRFVWFTPPTRELAREKDWVLSDLRNNRMIFQFARQDIDSLQKRTAEKGEHSDWELGVNLGSLAISYQTLDIALEVFGDELTRPRGVRIDWDPYTWLAFACNNKTEWSREIEREISIGNQGLGRLVAAFPDFYEKIEAVKRMVLRKRGRPFSVGVLDFGDVLWSDYGQHIALRRNLEAIVSGGSQEQLSRRIFNLPNYRDENGNTILASTIHPDANIKNSLILNSTLASPHSNVNNAVIFNSFHRNAQLPRGGISMFNTVCELILHESNCMAFECVAPRVELPAGGRQSTIIIPGHVFHLRANEAITDYSGDNYDKVILDNPMSFYEAASLVDEYPSTMLKALRETGRKAIIRSIIDES